MAENVTRVTLSQLADLSLNCPDLGTLNFSILHILLQVLIKQLQREDVTVEFRGKEANKIQGLMNASKPGPPSTFSEYNVTGGPDVKKSKSKEKKMSLTELQSGKRESRAGSNTVLVVETPGAVSRHTISIDKAHFDRMKDDIEGLKTQINELLELPGNLGLIDATKDSQCSPMLEMFQVMTLKKRMDANEAGVEKVVTLLEDVVKAASGGSLGQGPAAATILNQTAGVKLSIASEQHRKPSRASSFGGPGSPGSGGSKITNAGSIAGHVDGHMLSPEMVEQLINLETRLAEVEESIQILSGGATMNTTMQQATFGDLTAGGAGAGRPGADVGYGDPYDEEYTTDEYGNKKKKCAQTVGPSAEPSLLEGKDLASMPESEAMALIQSEIHRITEMLGGFDILTIMKDINILKEIRLDGPNAPPDVKITRMETKFSETVDQMNGLNTMYNQQITQIRQQISDVQHEVSEALEKINALLPGGDSSGLGEQGIIDLYNKFMQLQEEMSVIAETANKLIAEKETMQINMEGMLEQIDLLKIVKANREDLEEALDDKADACAVNRKVSHDQFDQACEDLTKGLEEALEKLMQQEEMWQQALEDIQKEIGNKLDKMEVEPLRDFVNQKLKGLQEKFKKLSHLKQETEAAGTRNKLLRNVNCISCDKDVVMRKEMDPHLKPKPFALPPTRSMAPYLAYELDQLRKQQKCIPGGKNLHHFENAVKGMKGPREKDHICNRYCGGSHTVTTPQQRVTRMGHFLEQYGPDVAPMGGDEFIRGNDNKMYKARDPPTERQSKTSSAVGGQKPSSARSPSGDNFVSKDGSQSDRAPKMNKEAEEILTREAGEKPRPKTSIDVIPSKMSSVIKITNEGGPSEIHLNPIKPLPSQGSKVKVQSANPSTEQVPARASMLSAKDGGAEGRASRSSSKNVGIGPAEGEEGQ